MIFSGVMDRTVEDSEIYKGNFIFEDYELVFLIYFVVGDEFGHGNSFDLEISSEGF